MIGKCTAAHVFEYDHLYESNAYTTRDGPNEDESRFFSLYYRRCRSFIISMPVQGRPYFSPPTPLPTIITYIVLLFRTNVSYPCNPSVLQYIFRYTSYVHGRWFFYYYSRGGHVEVRRVYRTCGIWLRNATMIPDPKESEDTSSPDTIAETGFSL